MHYLLTHVVISLFSTGNGSKMQLSKRNLVLLRSVRPEEVARSVAYDGAVWVQIASSRSLCWPLGSELSAHGRIKESFVLVFQMGDSNKLSNILSFVLPFYCNVRPCFTLLLTTSSADQPSACHMAGFLLVKYAFHELLARPDLRPGT